jgi:lactate dehydrogenase-like 2-hydroxyacid dehydrogenase
MAKPVLLVTRRMPPAVEARAAAEFDARLTQSDVPMTDVVAQAAGADAILTCPGGTFDAPLIAALPASVKVVATFSVGYDHIDVGSASARGIAVCNTPDVLSIATAETALLLILAAARRAGEGERLIRSGRWQGWAPTQLLGVGVVGRRLGIFGMGRIGRELAQLARGIGMTIHYRDVTRLPPALEAGAIFHDSDASFLASCDVLSLNAPGGEATHHWLNSDRIAMLPRGAVVVNAARGTLVDDAALIAALQSGQVGFAGLDVFEGEPELNPGYLGLENVVLLPHLGSATVTTRDAMGCLALDGIAAVLAGRKPGNLVTQQ